MNIQPIAFFHAPLGSKFGVPRQSGLVPSLPGEIVFVPEWAREEAVRGLAGFDWLWLVWGFSLNERAPKRTTVRPPRLGGNARMGVFATRSPFRPNNLGLSSVRLDRVEQAPGGCPIVHVLGADLADGTPIYDIKPYLPFTDSHPGARCGFVDAVAWHPLSVEWACGTGLPLAPHERELLEEVLRHDPRPSYQDEPARVYGMTYGTFNVRFSVSGGVLVVRSVSAASNR